MSCKCGYEYCNKGGYCGYKNVKWDGKKFVENSSPRNLEEFPAILDRPGTTSDDKGEDLLLRTYEVTLSPKGDIPEACYKECMEYIEKNCGYYIAVLERGKKSNQLHMHAAIDFKKPLNRKSVRDYFTRTVAKYFDRSKRKHAVVVVNMYNHDWYDEYLRKDADAVVLGEKYDREEVEKHFPTPEEQLILQQKQKDRDIVPIHVQVYNAWREDCPTDTTKRQLAQYMYAKHADDTFPFSEPRLMKNCLEMAWIRHCPTIEGSWIEKCCDEKVFKKPRLK